MKSAMNAKFQCNVCGKSCSSMSNKNTHAKLVHTEEKMKKYSCSHCEKSYVQTCDLKAHLVCHIEQPPGNLKCNICSSSFKTQKILGQHKQKHSQKNVQMCILWILQQTQRFSQNTRKTSYRRVPFQVQPLWEIFQTKHCPCCAHKKSHR